MQPWRLKLWLVEQGRHAEDPVAIPAAYVEPGEERVYLAFGHVRVPRAPTETEPPAELIARGGGEGHAVIAKPHGARAVGPEDG
jgi:hypothetical protein